MALHEKLAPYSAEDHISRFNKVLKFIAKDLRAVNCLDWNVELIRLGKTTTWERFFTYSNAGYQTEQIMVVNGQACDANFAVAIPMSVGLLRPYSIDISLSAPIEATATCRRFLLWSKWELSPPDPIRLKQLRQVQIPSVNLDHSWGGYTYRLSVGHEVISDPDDSSKSKWIVHSGFQGFVIGVGPRVAKYLKVAGKLEALLKQWNGESK